MKRYFIYLIFTVLNHFSFAQENNYEAKMISFAEYVAQTLPNFSQEKDSKIAVWDFTNIDKNNQNVNFNEMLANDLQIYLFKQKVGVLDRYKFEGARKEIKILTAGLNKQTAEMIGKLVPANAVLTGLYEIRANDIKLNIRVQDIESNELIAGDILLISLDNNIRKMLGLELECTKNNYTLRFQATYYNQAYSAQSGGVYYQQQYSSSYVHISKELLENIPYKVPIKEQPKNKNKQKDLPLPKEDNAVTRSVYVHDKLTVVTDIKAGEYYLLLTSGEGGKVINYKKINIQGCHDFHITVHNDKIVSIDTFKE